MVGFFGMPGHFELLILAGLVLLMGGLAGVAILVIVISRSSRSKGDDEDGDEGTGGR